MENSSMSSSNWGRDFSYSHFIWHFEYSDLDKSSLVVLLWNLSGIKTKDCYDTIKNSK